jgi:2Fe-2S ferredoxin
MVAISIRTRTGDIRLLEAEEGQSLMQLLRDAGLGVQGTCGGICSCGTCHIYASEGLLALVPGPEEDEGDMLEALADVVEVKACSRLSCQVIVTAQLDGASLEIAPQL